jgi:hypothetical protein
MTDALDYIIQADRCLCMAQFAMDEHVMKIHLRYLAQTWLTLARQRKRMDVLRDDLARYWATMH